MPQPSRAERRRHARGGAAPPPRRDPMRAVYIGIGVAIVVLIVDLRRLQLVAEPAGRSGLRHADARPERVGQADSARRRRALGDEVLQRQVSGHGAGRSRPGR